MKRPAWAGRPSVRPVPAFALAAVLVTALVMPFTAVRAADDASPGAAGFAQNCQLCHQTGAMGLPGTFPRLAGRVATISATAAGRAYVLDVLNNGMIGTLTVDRQSLTGVMPPFAQLPAELVAAILSYVQTLGDPPAKRPAPFTVAEVAAARAAAPKTPAEVLGERQRLVKAKVVP